MFFESFVGSSVEEFMFSTLLPFIMMFALFFGTLEIIKVFNRRINFVISLIFVLFALRSPLFPLFAQLLSTYGISAVLMIFVAVFIIGGIRWGFGTLERVGGDERKLKKLYKLRKKLMEEYERFKDRDEEAAKRILADVKNLDMEIEHLRRKLTQA